MPIKNPYTKKTKIVATLGPSTNSDGILKEMIEKGTDVFRINFSHATHEDAKLKIKQIRDLNDRYGFNAAIIADLQGPKLRIGAVEDDVFLHPGDVLSFSNEEIIGTKKEVFMTYKQFAQDVKPGEEILIDDGKLILKVTESDRRSKVKARVIQGGELKSNKGVNLPNTKISLPALTEKDIEDVLFAIEQEVDWLALSFVRAAQDVLDLVKLVKKNSNYKIPIIAKIEKSEAIENIDEILKFADGLMVARGDLGIEIPFEFVPKFQKELIDKAKIARKPVIVATQMMETMIESLTPSRAEVNDVANAVFDGADAVMLSGETSIGKHPIEVIKKMTKILQTVEEDEHIKIPSHKPKIKNERFITNVICFNAAKMVASTDAKIISTITHSGYTAFQISSYRPHAYILVFTPNKRVMRMLSLVWGVKAMYYEANKSTDESVIEVNKIAIDKGFIKWGDYVINLNAMPVFEKGITNTIRLTTA